MTELKYLKTKYPKIYENPLNYLLGASVTFNSQCNAKCLGCTGRLCEDKPMPLEKAKEVMKVLIDDLKLSSVWISGSAEMTLYPYLIELMKYVDGFHRKNIIVAHYTNGRYIPKGFIEQINSMKNIVWQIQISVWGYDEESWQKYQGKGNWKQFVENCKRYLTEMNISPSFSIVSITNEQREKTFEFVTNLIKECGLNYVRNDNATPEHYLIFEKEKTVPINIQKYKKWTEDDKGNKKNIGMIDREDTKNIDTDFVKYNNCYLLYHDFVMDSIGNIYPCLQLQGWYDYRIGNVNDYNPFTKESLYEIYKGEKAMQYWKDNFTYKKFPCDKCSDCIARICF